jgi:hypothetical protein
MSCSLRLGRRIALLINLPFPLDQIPAKYQNIFVDKEIIRELERVTRLSLERKKSFSCGVLEGNRVTGAIL